METCKYVENCKDIVLHDKAAMVMFFFPLCGSTGEALDVGMRVNIILCNKIIYFQFHL